MNAPSRPRARLLVFLALGLLLSGNQQCKPAVYMEAGREPCSNYAPYRQPLFGDTHSHSTHSFDAVMIETRTTPREAYAFAKGTAPLDLPPYDANDVAQRSTQIARPLDWGFVTDHAEYFGETVMCMDPGSVGYASQECVLYRDAIPPPPGQGLPLGFLVFGFQLVQPSPTPFAFCGVGRENCLSVAESVWLEIQAAAEEHYDRTSACEFTTFVAYEWTANTNQQSLHRNVVFRNEIVPTRPVSYFEVSTPEALHDALQTTCLDSLPGCDVLAIPHSSNQSNGAMFDFSSSSAVQNAKRASFETLVEITQHKGESECRTGVLNNDETCGFEKLDRLGLLDPPNPNQTFPPGNYVRTGLRAALVAEDTTGVNPMKVGFVGGTDGHANMLGNTEEQGWPGHQGIVESSPELRLAEVAALGAVGVETNPGGLTVLWAEENARESLWGAMRRRESYATSGTRPVVRFFGGSSLPTEMCSSGAFVESGYVYGVPMGGDLPPVPPGGAPRFAVLASQDPGTAGSPGTPLQRIQIIKGWVDAAGVSHETTIEVAGDPNNGADVDLATCTPTGPGASTLCAVWEDPNFDPSEDAFYYAKVIENPTCRWSTWECLAEGITCNGEIPSVPGFESCCSPNVEKTVQERAWTSPIWHSAAP